MVSSTPPDRFASLDTLRGFDMCWILGMHSVVAVLVARLFPSSSWAAVLVGQFEHAPWSGFRFYDLIFPLFVFLSGVSLAIALPKRVERSGVRSAAIHLLVRCGLLFTLGVFYNGGLADGLDKVRWMGVLQRIGIASCVGGLLSLTMSTRRLAYVAVGILVAYALPFYLVPVPGSGALGFEEGNNIANYLDQILLPGRLHAKTWDPEGLLSSLPAISTSILGLLCGRLLTSGRQSQEIIQRLLLAGASGLVLGWGMHPFCPVIKKLWTPSFVLVAAGWSAVLFAVFFWLIDVKGWVRWTSPFLWIGANPIFLYILGGMGVFQKAGERLAGKGLVPSSWLGPIAGMVVLLWVARWLYQRRIFIRL